MNGHARTVYSTLSRGYDFFFPIVYDFVQSLLSFDDDVLILPDAVSTPIDDGPYISLRW